MRSRALAVQGILLVSLAAGCAKTPATTTAAAPAPTGSAVTTSRAGGGGGARPASAVATPARERVDQFRAIGDLADIHFAFDKYDIRDGDAKILDANATWLKGHPQQLLLIEGHCDERGTVEYNLALGERRAKAAQNYLAAHGVATARVSVVSYGKERPQCSESTEACWQQNRRARFLVKGR